ncbi:hypothetical protein F5984_13215 [Rudanella paleaurantiibacter]|uniref:Uncharacterized protein n=1 Tax=Rudanella paleaurantiibacter TaxID=2614655 RepID=A0A7J5TYV9_9BACT|nr:hypothetical protein [Rudanella paleaurantiibacter]KAB7730137.1 hypothetical protein F5984_13215 [Rudanella paleaurantiibacter]
MNNIVQAGSHTLAYNVLATRHFARAFNLSTDPAQIMRFVSALHPDEYMIELVRAGLEGYAKTQNKSATYTEWQIVEIINAGTPEQGVEIFDAFVGSLYRKTTEEARRIRLEMEAALAANPEPTQETEPDPNAEPQSGPAGEN